MSSRASLLLLAACLLLLGALPASRSLFWQNVGQLQRLHGQNEQGARSLERALSLNPTNAHLRWQTGTALLQVGEHQTALATLEPLLDQPTTDPHRANVLLYTLILGERFDEALALARRLLADAVPLAPSSSARLILAAFERPGVDRDLTDALLSQHFALGGDGAAARAFLDQLYQPGFWGSPSGERVRAGLEWQSTPLAPLVAAAGAAEPAETLAARAARLLNLGPEHVQLGANLIVNGDFERPPPAAFTGGADITPGADPWPRGPLPFLPAGWQPLFMASCAPWSCSAFAVGTDTSSVMSGHFALRLDGLLVEQQPGREDARAGVVYPSLELEADTPYIISFAYRTQALTTPAVTLWLSGDAAVLHAGELSLPPTASTWRRATIIAWNRSGTTTTVPLMLRLWGEGQVWFDDLSARPLRLTEPVEPRELVLAISEP